MKILIFFTLSFLLFAQDFSWTPYSRGVSPNSYTGKAVVKKDLRKKILMGVDPKSIAMDDHRQKQKLTILLLGDSGTGKPDQYQVGKFMVEECQKVKCDFALGLGDMIYETGLTKGEVLNPKDLELMRERFEKPYELFGSMNFWVVPGNHDWYGNVQKSINYSRISTRWRMPYNHYEIPYLPEWIKIKGIDTTRVKQLSPQSRLVMEQLPDEMEGFEGQMGPEDMNSFCKSQGWKILFGHHGIYTSGFHGKINEGSFKSLMKGLDPRRQKGTIPEMKEILEPIITRCNIPLYIVGHDHHQEFIKVINPRNKKTLYYQIIQGSAGKVRDTFDFKNDEYESIIKRPFLGFGILTMTPMAANIKYYGYPEGRPKEFKKYFEYNFNR